VRFDSNINIQINAGRLLPLNNSTQQDRDCLQGLLNQNNVI